LLLSATLTLYSAYAKRLGVRSISWYTLLFQMCLYVGMGRREGEGGERLLAMLFSHRPFNSPPFPLRYAARSTARRLDACVTSQREKED